MKKILIIILVVILFLYSIGITVFVALNWESLTKTDLEIKDENGKITNDQVISDDDEESDTGKNDKISNDDGDFVKTITPGLPGEKYESYSQTGIKITYPSTWKLTIEENPVVDIGQFKLSNDKYSIHYTERTDMPYICLFDDTTEEDKDSYGGEISYLFGNTEKGAYKEYFLNNGEGVLRLYYHPEGDDEVLNSCYRTIGKKYFQDFHLALEKDKDDLYTDELESILKSIEVGYPEIY